MENISKKSAVDVDTAKRLGSLIESLVESFVSEQESVLSFNKLKFISIHQQMRHELAEYSPFIVESGALLGLARLNLAYIEVALDWLTEILGRQASDEPRQSSCHALVRVHAAMEVGSSLSRQYFSNISNYWVNSTDPRSMAQVAYIQSISTTKAAIDLCGKLLSDPSLGPAQDPLVSLLSSLGLLLAANAALHELPSSIDLPTWMASSSSA